MKLYNTRTRQIEAVRPLASETVTIYSCGPTVYDYQHIGNYYTYVRTDTLIRALHANGFETHWVMNITDVGHLVSDGDEGEDKLEKGARREGKSAWEIADFYTKDFLKSMALLNISPRTDTVKATGHIQEQIELIQKLEAMGYTYVIDDGVYYDTSKFSQYADFAQLDLDEQQAGARINVNPQKRQASDFALWKFSPKDQQRDMEWDSPFSDGRKGFPGWHIECSAMAMKYLGETIDIHTGGIDHIPVHHTNEIAQSEAATGKRFANYWLHSNHVMVEGAKISKSLGNGITLKYIAERGYNAEVVRLYILESHYRKQAEFNWDGLGAAAKRLSELNAMAALRWQALPVAYDASTFALETVPEQLAAIVAEDLNTPQALAFLSQVTTQMLAVLIEKDMVVHFEKMLQGIDAILGTKLYEISDITDDQKELIAARETARKNKDWVKADAIRATLTDQGIDLRDTQYGVIWSYVA